MSILRASSLISALFTAAAGLGQESASVSGKIDNAIFDAAKILNRESPHTDGYAPSTAGVPSGIPILSSVTDLDLSLTNAADACSFLLCRGQIQVEKES